MSLRIFLMLASMLLLGACTTESKPPATSSPAFAAADARGASAGTVRSSVEVPAPPAPPVVIEAIFQNPGDRSASYEVDNGSWATYWFGHTYQVDGKPHYTGFVEQSPDRLGSEAAANDPPSAPATLTQATFTADGTPGWTFLGAQRAIGEIGSRGRADAVDRARTPVTHEIGPGRLLLAVPTNSAIEQGTVQKNYEMLMRAADGAWTHVGTVNAGHDDSAGCDGGRVFPCAPVSGRMTFEGGNGSVPSIHVALEPGGSKADGARVVIYRFDPSTSTYRAAGAD